MVVVLGGSVVVVVVALVVVVVVLLPFADTGAWLELRPSMYAPPEAASTTRNVPTAISGVLTTS